MTDAQGPSEVDLAKFRAIARKLILPHVFLVAAGVAAVLWFVLYGMNGGRSKETSALDAACPVSTALAEKIAPLASGDFVALAVHARPKPALELAFKDDAGPKSLSDLKSKTLLVNFWATWCAPCREEMPALDRLQGQMGGEKFTVAPINLDTAKPARAREFFDSIGVKNLTLYADPSGKTMAALQQAGKLIGLPTTLLIGPDGCEIASLSGPAKWDGVEALNLLRAATPN